MRRLLYAAVVWGALTTAVARADVNTFDVAAAPVVRINVRAGNVTVRTWDRESVQVDADPSVSIERRPFHGTSAMGSLPIAASGRAGSDTFLPAESFVPGPITGGAREAIVIRSDANAPPGPVTVTVPYDSPLVVAVAHGGSLDVHGYRAGTFVGYTTFGRLSVQNGGGVAFLQSNRGAIVVSDSTFDRIRARSLTGNITFERCVVRQIETTSIGGSVVFDGGSFEPGLARFESFRGDVAIGSESAAELSAHTATGHVYSNFLAPTSVNGNNAETHVTISGGGPFVTAASESGNVFLYDGSLRSRSMPPEWYGPAAILQRPGERREGPLPRPFAREYGERRAKFRAIIETMRR